MKNKQLHFRVSEQCENWLIDNFTTKTGGAEHVLEMCMSIYKHTLYELRGQFEEDELKLFLDAFNGHTLTSSMAGQELWWSVSECIKYEALDQKWSINREDILYKINQLDRFECACLEIWATGFWYGGSSDKTLDIEKRVQTLMPPRI